MWKIFELIGRYFMLMGKVFSRPEKAAIYRRRIIYEMESLGIDSIGLTAIISVFIGAVITLKTEIMASTSIRRSSPVRWSVTPRARR